MLVFKILNYTWLKPTLAYIGLLFFLGFIYLVTSVFLKGTLGFIVSNVLIPFFIVSPFLLAYLLVVEIVRLILYAFGFRVYAKQELMDLGLYIEVPEVFESHEEEIDHYIRQIDRNLASVSNSIRTVEFYKNRERERERRRERYR